MAAVDVQPDKLGLAKRLGSAHTVDASAIDPAQAIPGGGADVAITLAVQPNLIEGAFALAAPSWSVRVRLAAEGLSARGADR